MHLRLSVAELSFFLLLCGKFYFLFGFVGHLKPVAPVAIIAARDFFVLAFILLSLPWWRRQMIFDQKSMVIFILILFLSSLLHLDNFSALSYLQHYIRNSIIPFSAFLCFLAIFQSKYRLAWIPLLVAFATLNSIIALAQVHFFDELTLDGLRPLGLVGDPIVLSFFSVIGFYALLFLPCQVFVSPLAFLFGIVFTVGASVSVAFALFFSSLITMTTLLLAVGFKAVFDFIVNRLTSLTIWVLGILAGLLLFPDQLAFRLKSIFLHLSSSQLDPIQRMFIETSVQGRITSWNKIVDRGFFDGDSLGQGSNVLERSIELLGHAHLAPNFQRDKFTIIENNFLSLAANFSVPSAIFYILICGAFFGMGLKMIWRSNLELAKNHEVVCSLLIISGLLVLDCFNTTYYRFPINFLLPLAMAAIANQKNLRSYNGQ